MGINIDTTNMISVDQLRDFTSIRPAKRHEESLIQQACVEWFNKNPKTNMYWLIKLKNEGKMGGKTVTGKNGKQIPLEAIIAKREGLRPGVADLQLVLGNEKYNSLFLECKTDRGTQSKEQKDFEAYCKKHRFQYVVFRSLEQFIGVIYNYLGINN